MRGCLTLLVLVGAVGYVFVALGFSIAALVIGFVIWCVLWFIAFVCAAIADATKRVDQEEEEMEDDESPVR